MARLLLGDVNTPLLSGSTLHSGNREIKQKRQGSSPPGEIGQPFWTASKGKKKTYTTAMDPRNPIDLNIWKENKGSCQFVLFWNFFSLKTEKS